MEMKILHVSPIKNTDSILKNGLIGQQPLLDVFNEFVSNSKLGIVFGINCGTYKQDKYLKDTSYWKIYGDPRNKYLKDMPYDECYIYLEKGPDNFNHIHFQLTDFSIFEANITDQEYYECIHQQYPEMSEFWMDMDSNYEHFWKPLIVMNGSIKPENIKHIGFISVDINKKGKIITNLKYHKEGK